MTSVNGFISLLYKLHLKWLNIQRKNSTYEVKYKQMYTEII